MTDARMIARLGLSGVAVAETAATWSRWEQRRRLFLAADERARQLGRPLLVVLPRKEGWWSRSMRLYEYGPRYGDIFNASDAPVIFADSLAHGLPAILDDSAVVYVACVLEYVTDLRRSMDEILRIAGELENIYVVTVQPWTLTAALHPAARWAGIVVPLIGPDARLYWEQSVAKPPEARESSHCTCTVQTLQLQATAPQAPGWICACRLVIQHARSRLARSVAAGATQIRPPVL